MQLSSGFAPAQPAIYIRWSTEDQADGTTLEVQLEACQSYIRSQLWPPAGDSIFVDDGVSGGTLDRPALTRLRQEVRAGRIDCVVVYKLDRLSRSVVDMVRLVLDEWEGRCHVKSAREPIDTVSQTGKLFFYQLMSFAEWERSVIKERTFAGKLRRAQEGKNPGLTAAYGYRLGSDGEFLQDPGEAGVVEQIFKLYLSGLGVRLIARKLDELGHLSPAGRRWDPSTIARMLANPIYKGTLVYGRDRPGEPHVVREGAAPPIVDEATWEAVQKAKAGRPGVGRRGVTGRTLSSQSLLTGVLSCRCGRSYMGTQGAGARGRYRYYACTAANGKGPEECRAGRIRMNLLDERVTGELLERFGSEAARERVLRGLGEQLAAGLQEAQVALKAAQREGARLSARESRLRGAFLDGKLTPEEYQELRSDLRLQAGVITAREEEAQARIAQLRKVEQEGRRLTAELSLVGQWAALEPHERKQLLRHFISRVTAYRDLETGQIECGIEWRGALAGNS